MQVQVAAAYGAGNQSWYFFSSANSCSVELLKTRYFYSYLFFSVLYRFKRHLIALQKHSGNSRSLVEPNGTGSFAIGSIFAIKLLVAMNAPSCGIECIRQLTLSIQKYDIIASCNQLFSYSYSVAVQ